MHKTCKNQPCVSPRIREADFESVRAYHRPLVASLSLAVNKQGWGAEPVSWPPMEISFEIARIVLRSNAGSFIIKKKRTQATQSR